MTFGSFGLSKERIRIFLLFFIKEKVDSVSKFYYFFETLELVRN